MSKQAKQFTTMIFDLDGTLIDSLLDIADAANKTLESMKYPIHPVDAYRQFVGDGLLTLAQRIAPEHTKEDKIAEIVKMFKVHYDRNWDLHTRPYPGIMDMLQKVAESGINTAVLSNKPDEFTRICAARFFPDIAFGQVFGNRKQVPKKPDPKAALELAAHFQTPPESCLFVGDSRVDIMTGKAAGMTSMGVTWGFRERRELEEAGADIIVDSPADIVSFVLVND